MFIAWYWIVLIALVAVGYYLPFETLLSGIPPGQRCIT